MGRRSNFVCEDLTELNWQRIFSMPWNNSDTAQDALQVLRDLKSSNNHGVSGRMYKTTHEEGGWFPNSINNINSMLRKHNLPYRMHVTGMYKGVSFVHYLDKEYNLVKMDMR